MFRSTPSWPNDFVVRRFAAFGPPDQMRALRVRSEDQLCGHVLLLSNDFSCLQGEQQELSHVQNTHIMAWPKS